MTAEKRREYHRRYNASSKGRARNRRDVANGITKATEA